VAIECKWSAGSFDPGGMHAFRRRHPGSINLVVAADVDRPFERRYGSLRVRFLGLGDMAGLLARRRARRKR
jgi:hypothetical protein